MKTALVLISVLVASVARAHSVKPHALPLDPYGVKSRLQQDFQQREQERSASEEAALENKAVARAEAEGGGQVLDGHVRRVKCDNSVDGPYLWFCFEVLLDNGKGCLAASTYNALDPQGPEMLDQARCTSR